jgi:hypothetical protein
MKKLAVILSLLPALATAECVLNDRTVTRVTATISERSTIRPEVVPAIGGGKKCMVTFRVRIGNDWHSAFGEHTWAGDRSRDEACARAVQIAENDVRDRVGRTQAISEKTMVCTDNPELDALRRTNPGTMGPSHQFRPHPDYPNRFWHNGAQCRMFLEPAWNGRDIQSFQGIICQVQDDIWVVVDKF